jgi:hypothetical protein
MTIKRPKVSVEHFYGQFHNEDQPHFHSINHATKEWWQTHDDLPEKDMAKPVHYKQGGLVKHKKHPAHGIPGVHIVTADAGEPVFTGAL